MLGSVQTPGVALSVSLTTPILKMSQSTDKAQQCAFRGAGARSTGILLLPVGNPQYQGRSALAERGPVDQQLRTPVTQLLPDGHRVATAGPYSTERSFLDLGKPQTSRSNQLLTIYIPLLLLSYLNK
jgi:hypothetical protein